MVLFKEALRGLYLGVEGILLEDIVCTDGFNLQDSLFCVHLARQYSASRDLNAFLDNYGGELKNIEDESAKKYLLALQVCTIIIVTKYLTISLQLQLSFCQWVHSEVCKMKRS